MKIGIVGYGKMGKEIEKEAINRGHQISMIIDLDNYKELQSESFASSDVALEFSTPETAFNNIKACFKSGVPVVSGTTGWLDNFSEAVKLCDKYNGSFLYASNFSLGVNILFRLNHQLAGIMDNINDYHPSIKEIHHLEKLDSPSGTAINLADGIINECNRIDRWTIDTDGDKGEIKIESLRKGRVPGTHSVVWISEADKISLKHEAFSRKGFAVGAVFAAEFIYNKKVIFTMSDMLGF